MIITQYRKYLNEDDIKKWNKLSKELHEKLEKLSEARNNYYEAYRYHNDFTNNLLTDKQKKAKAKELKELQLNVKICLNEADIIQKKVRAEEKKIRDKGIKAYTESFELVADKESKLSEETKETLNSITKEEFEYWLDFTGSRNTKDNKVDNKLLKNQLLNFIYANLEDQIAVIKYYKLDNKNFVELVNNRVKEILGNDIDITNPLSKYIYTYQNKELNALGLNALQNKGKAEVTKDIMGNETFKIGNVELTYRRYETAEVVGETSIDKKEKNKIKYYEDLAHDINIYCLSELAPRIKNTGNDWTKVDRKVMFNINDFAKLKTRNVKSNNALKAYKADVWTCLLSIGSIRFSTTEKVYNRTKKEWIEHPVYPILCDKLYKPSAEGNGQYGVSYHEDFIKLLCNSEHTQILALPVSYYSISNKDKRAKAILRKLYDYYFMPNNLVKGNNNKIKIANLISVIPGIETENNLRKWRDRIVKPFERDLELLAKLDGGINYCRYVLKGKDNIDIGMDLEEAELKGKVEITSYADWKNKLYLQFELRDSEELKKRILEKKEKSKAKAEEEKKKKEKAKQKAIEKNIANKEKAKADE